MLLQCLRWKLQLHVSLTATTRTDKYYHQFAPTVVKLSCVQPLSLHISLIFCISLHWGILSWASQRVSVMKYRTALRGAKSSVVLFMYLFPHVSWEQTAKSHIWSEENFLKWFTTDRLSTCWCQTLNTEREQTVDYENVTAAPFYRHLHEKCSHSTGWEYSNDLPCYIYLTPELHFWHWLSP